MNKTLTTLILAVAAQFCSGQTRTGGKFLDNGAFIDMNVGLWRPPSILFASLPAASGANIHQVYEVFDCATSACSAGLGTTIAWKVSDGSAWVTISGAGGGGSPQIQNTGSNVGSPRATLNFIQGTCGSLAASDTGTAINLTLGTDSAVCPTKANLQSGASVLLTETSASATVYTATMSPTLTAYTAGMKASWIVGTSCTGGVATSLNIDALGAKSVKLADGTTDPTSGDCPAGRNLTLSYDGTLFRIVAGGVSSSSTAIPKYWYPGASCFNSGGSVNAINFSFTGTGTSAVGCLVSAGGISYAYETLRSGATAYLSHMLASTTSTLTIVAKLSNEDAVSGNWELDFSAGCIANNGSDNPTLGTMVPITHATPAVNLWTNWSATVTPSGTCAAGNLVVIKIEHVADSNGDVSWAKFLGAQVIEQ